MSKSELSVFRAYRAPRELMGVYDFFRGPCPHCGGQIDTHPEYGVCGDIQTKAFDFPRFRSYRPGDVCPKPPSMRMRIGETVCCGKDITVVFRNETPYKIVKRFSYRLYSEAETKVPTGKTRYILDRYEK